MPHLCLLRGGRPVVAEVLFVPRQDLAGERVRLTAGDVEPYVYRGTQDGVRAYRAAEEVRCAG